MANAFSKEQITMYGEVLEGFQDALVASKLIKKYPTDQTTMERTNDVIWRPVPYITKTIDGSVGVDITSQITDMTQLTVPSRISMNPASAFKMNAKQLRDQMQDGSLAEAAYQALASHINVKVMSVASKQGSLFVKRPGAPTGFDDMALIDSLMAENGMSKAKRYALLSNRTYNSMAGNLAARQTMQGKPDKAYNDTYIGNPAGIETHKLEYGVNIVAAAGGNSLTIDTRDAGNNYYVPKSTETFLETPVPVDNRFQTITISSTTGVKEADVFTIAGIFAVHPITKENTGQLKTFRVISVTNSTSMVVTPPIISNQVSAPASAQYQNCVAETKSQTAAIVWQNTTTAIANPFWYGNAMEILPGRLVIEDGAGTAVMRATLDNGLEVVMQKKQVFEKNEILFRFDVLYGVTMLNTEMAGIMMFNQA